MAINLRRDILGIAFIGALGLSGCDKLVNQDVSCDSASATDVTASLLKQQIEKSADAKAKQTDGTYSIPLANIRATIDGLKITLEQIRTTKKDPDSSKRFCAATAKVVFPINALTDAERAREIAQVSKLSDLTDSAKIERNADTFSFGMEYDVQPTDDHKTIYAESDSIDAAMGAFAEIVNSSLLRAGLENQASAQQQQQQALADAQKAAAEQAAQASQDQAKAEDALSVQAINATWQAISPDVRAQILDAQRAWIKAKIAQCNVEAAAASIDPVEKEAARLKCDATANQGRTEYLKQYMPRM